MKYTKEYCRKNKIAIHVITIEQLKKVEELFDRDYSDFGCNVATLKYPNQYLIPYRDGYGNVYGEGKNYTIITFEELMQDLNQKENMWVIKSSWGTYTFKIINNSLKVFKNDSKIECYTFVKKDVLNLRDLKEIPYYGTPYGSHEVVILKEYNCIRIGCCKITNEQYEEIVQELTKNDTKSIEMKKQYKHKSGVTATQLDDKFYKASNGDTLANWLIEDSQDWEEIKPKFKPKVGDYVTILPTAMSGFASTLKNKTTKVIDVSASTYFICEEDTRKDGIWNEAARLATEAEILEYNKPKKGDYMIHIVDDTQYWSKGKIFQFGRENNGYTQVMGESANCATINCRKATPEEIQAYKESQELKIGEHKLEIIRTIKNGDYINKAKFGCQEFNLEELKAIRRLFGSNIRAKITILEGTEITLELLDKIIAKL